MGGAEALVFAGFLAAASAWDLREQRIPNALNMGFAIVGLGLRVFHGGLPGLAAGFGGLAVGFAVGIVLYLVRQSVGMGDVKLLAAAGAWMAPLLAAEATMIALVGGWVWVVAVLAGRAVRNLVQRRRILEGLTQPVPLVPGLAGGYGAWLLAWTTA